MVKKLRTFTIPSPPEIYRRGGGYIGLILLAGLLATLPISEAVLSIGGLIGGAALLINPLLALYLLIPTIPFSALLAVSFGGLRLGLMELLLIAGIGSWGLGLMVRREPFPPLSQLNQRAPFLWPMGIFLVGILLSWLHTLSLKASLIETIKWLEMLLLYLWLVLALPKRHLPYVITVILLTGIAQAMIGLYQFIFKVGPEGFLLFGGLFLRAYGTFGQPNPYAGYLGLVLPLAISLTYWHGMTLLTEPSRATSQTETNGGRIRFTVQSRLLILLLIDGLLFSALFATQSRSGWLAAILAIGVVMMILSRWVRVSALIAGLLIMLIGLVGSLQFTLSSGPTLATHEATPYEIVLQRLMQATEIFQIEDVGSVELTDSNFATLERLAHWQAAWHMWRDAFWLGQGFGNYEVVYPAYAIGRWEDALGHAHNYLFNLGAETGLVGVTTYIIFWILVFAVTWHTIHHTMGLERAIVVGCFGSLIHLHSHNMFDNLYVQGMYLHVAIMLALISIVRRSL